LGFLLTFGSPAFAKEPSADDSEVDLKITVRVYDYAQVSRGTLTAAERAATGIFNAAGIELTWVNCVGSSQASHNDLDCHHPLGNMEVVLRVLPRSTPVGAQFSGSVLGFSYGEAVASVFYDRIEDAANKMYGVWWVIPAILGHVMAHELGHLFLGPGSHSDLGMMHGRWDQKDLRQAVYGRLLFTPQQAELIHAEVLARLGQQRTTERNVLTKAM
jgi:hypothetical protein